MEDQVTPELYIQQLDGWSKSIKRKQSTLVTGYRVYMTLFALKMVITLTLAAVVGGLSAYTAGSSDTIDTDAIFGISLAILAATVISAIWTAGDLALQFNKTAMQSAISAKQYDYLYRELEVEIKSVYTSLAKMEDINMGRLQSKLLMYCSREQLILNTEPGMILIGYGSHTSILDDANRVVHVLNAEDIQRISEYVSNLEEGEAKEELSKILYKVLRSYSEV